VLDVCANADIVSLHVAANKDTKGLANRAFFEAMRPGALFINTTRGSVVDEEALKWALDHKGIRAGLDVFEHEPAAKEGECAIPLASHPNVYITHHIGASTDQAQDVTALEAARIINKYAAVQIADNCVNTEDSEALHTGVMTVRHLNKVGVLAAILEEIRGAGWNVSDVNLIMFCGGQAASARIGFTRQGSTADPKKVQSAVQALGDVLAATLQEAHHAD